MKQINLKLGLAIGCVALTVLAVPFLYAGLVRLYYLYWSGDNIEKLLFEDLGFSRSWSSFFGVVGSFVFALAWVPLAFWTYRIFAGRVSGRQIGLAFASWILVYGHVPLLHALLGTNKCFNQRTGDYMKWYVEGPAGEIILSDSRGYDPVTRVERRPVTPEICAAWFAQSTQTPPRRITAQISEVEFFNPTSGQPVVWYSNSAECGFNLFNSKGFDPSTGEQLRPVNHEVISHIMACQRTAAIKPASTTPSPVLSPSPDLSLPGPYRTADICGGRCTIDWGRIVSVLSS